MNPTFNFITFGVDDLERSVAFYRDGLGCQTEGIVGQEFHDEVTGADGTIAFFTFENGILLGLYERKNLAQDAQVKLDSESSTEFSIGYPANSKKEVDSLLKIAETAGAHCSCTHETIWSLLWILQRPRWAFMGNCL
jgi:catechol 2,3-dioxygenase-like lactoylglutathione lyase family enzyme